MFDVCVCTNVHVNRVVWVLAATLWMPYACWRHLSYLMLSVAGA